MTMTHFIKAIKHLLQALASLSRQLHHSVPTVIQRRYLSVLELWLGGRWLTILLFPALSRHASDVANCINKAQVDAQCNKNRGV